MTTDHYIEEPNLSIAWARALTIASGRGRSEVAPLIVSITGFDDKQNFVEEPSVRTMVDGLLKQKGLREFGWRSTGLTEHRARFRGIEAV